MLCTTAARPGACSVAHTPRQVAPAVRLESPAPSRRAHRRHAKLHCVAERTASASAPPPPAASGAATALGAGSLPFHPDCRCGGEDVPLPPLSQCHHYINLTNGIEAVPRLQALGLSYRFLRLPSTRCEQQQFEQLVNDLDADLLIRLALGETCLVHDLGSRNKKRGAPRALWYGLEFIKFALRRLWLGERGEAYLRGYNVADVFEGHVRAFSDNTKKKLRYYARFIGPAGLPRLHLYGVYAATGNDGDKDMYRALLRRCEGADDASSSSIGTPAAPEASSSSSTAAAADAAGADAAAAAGAAAAAAAAHAAAQAAAEAVLAAARAPLAGLYPQYIEALLHGPDTSRACEELLGMRLFVGGVSHSRFQRWVADTGYVPPDGGKVIL